MSDDLRRQARVRLAVSVSAVCFAVVGIMLLFAPAETARALSLAIGPAAGQLLGAALLGFAAMNWTARGSLLGGIYGRAVVSANQVHTTIGAIVLVKHGLAAGRAPGYWALTIVYLAGAALFLLLLFYGGPPRNRTSS